MESYGKLIQQLMEKGHSTRAERRALLQQYLQTKPSAKPSVIKLK